MLVCLVMQGQKSPKTEQNNDISMFGHAGTKSPKTEQNNDISLFGHAGTKIILPLSYK